MTELESPLSPAELSALTALLTSASIVDAAKAAGIDERTLRRYLARPAFRAALREAQGAAVTVATGKLAESCGRAVDALLDVIDDPEAPHAAKVSAARTILTSAHEAVVSNDLAARIEALEEATGRANQPPRGVA